MFTNSKTILASSLLVLMSAASIGLVFGGILPTPAPTPTADVAPNATAQNGSQQQPLSFPALANYLVFEPMIEFNNRLVVAANQMPAMIGGEGSQVGSALARPVELVAKTGNNFMVRLNNTLMGVPNAAAQARTDEQQPPVLLGWLGRMAMNALNFTTTRVGERIIKVGDRWTNAGQRVQNISSNINAFVVQIQQTLNGTTQTSTPVPELTTLAPAVVTSAPAASTSAPIVVTSAPIAQNATSN